MADATQTLTLTEFLLARIAEDQDALDGMPKPISVIPTDSDPDIPAWLVGRIVMERDRLLAECEAKRRIVEESDHGLRGFSADVLAASLQVGGRALMHLALPYADHPDYRDEWRS